MRLPVKSPELLSAFLVKTNIAKVNVFPYDRDKQYQALIF
jgi:hypothetical protein